VSLREKVAVPEAEWAQAISELVECPHVEEAAILSTCNRMEVYVQAVSWQRGSREVIQWMAKYGGVSEEELIPYLFVLRDRDAVNHLLRVSSGLESLVLGEGQILAQTKAVYQAGQDIPGFGRNLNGLFKQAVTCGKRARAECRLSEGAVSVSSAAVELMQMKLDAPLAEARIAIVGAGTMSRLLVKHAESKGVTKMTLLNRTMPRAEALAADFPDVSFDIQLMPEMLRVVGESDIVFVASGSAELLLTEENCAGLPAASAAVAGVRRYVDISVPRNVGAEVAGLEGSAVYNVDDLKEVVEANKAERQRRAKMAEGVLADELATFESWRDSLETVPTIKRLRNMAEDIRVSELEKCMGKMGELSKKERKAVEELSRGIMNKLLHGPMQALRSDGDVRTVSETIENMHALERMFDLKKLAAAEAAAKVEQARAK
jgi:glutamyl-tRNA reductase